MKSSFIEKRGSSTYYPSIDGNELHNNTEEENNSNDINSQDIKIEEIKEEERDQWSNHIEFFLTIVGFAVGVGNIWRFPYLVYEYGGGAFLIPYWLSVFIIGIPMFALELGVGQRFRVGTIEVWKKIEPKFIGVGIATTVIPGVVGLYYNVIMVWSTFYFINSFEDPLPWEDGSNVQAAENYFWDNIQKTDNIIDLGEINWKLTGCHSFCWIILFFCLFKGIKSAGKVVYFTALFPYFVLIVLFFRGVTLDGAQEGIEYYLSPDWGKLLSPQTWMAACQQIFFSLSVCFGTHITYGSFNPMNSNFIRDTWLVSIINCMTSFFAGFVVFSCLGFMAHERGVDVSEVVESGTSLAFIAYPEALAQMPVSPLFSTLFFLMMFCLGIDSEFGFLETVITGIMEWEMKPKNMPKWQVVGCVCLVGWSIGLIFMTGGGFYILNMFDYFASLVVLFAAGMLECIAIAWIYGVDKFIDDIHLMTGIKLHNIWKIVWKYICPILLGILLVVSFTTYASNFDELFCKSFEDENDQLIYFDCPSLTVPVVFGVLLSLVSAIWIPVGFIMNWKKEREEIPGLTENDILSSK